MKSRARTPGRTLTLPVTDGPSSFCCLVCISQQTSAPERHCCWHSAGPCACHAQATAAIVSIFTFHVQSLQQLLGTSQVIALILCWTGSASFSFTVHSVVCQPFMKEVLHYRRSDASNGRTNSHDDWKDNKQVPNTYDMLIFSMLCVCNILLRARDACCCLKKQQIWKWKLFINTSIIRVAFGQDLDWIQKHM